MNINEQIVKKALKNSGLVVTAVRPTEDEKKELMQLATEFEKKQFTSLNAMNAFKEFSPEWARFVELKDKITDWANEYEEVHNIAGQN